ncbi:hypothetical protein [Priestia megaterium]|uniref:hypothetical protein n=1 Tax=Priestia megaterium TaxID=1404 RepID=UPI00366C8D26
MKKMMTAVMMCGILAACSMNAEETTKKESTQADQKEISNEDTTTSEESSNEPSEEVETQPIVDQAQLTADFEADMNTLNSNLNNFVTSMDSLTILIVANDIPKAQQEATTVSTNVENVINHLAGMQDYASIEKYPRTYSQLPVPIERMPEIKMNIDTFIQTGNKDDFFKALEQYNEFVKEMKVVGHMYTAEQGQ